VSENNMVFKTELGKHSAPGINRPQNDTQVGYYLPPQPEVLHVRGQMFVIADGESENQQGYIASKLAVETLLQEYYDADWSGIPQEMLARAIDKANKRLMEYSGDEGEGARFTSSASCVVIIHETLYLAQVGNCRVYVLGSDQNLQELGLPLSEEAGPSFQFAPFSDGLDRSKALGKVLGADTRFHADIFTRKVAVNDVILLCTEGVYGNLQSSELAEILVTTSPQEASEIIVSAALDYKAQHDATSLIVKLKGVRRLTTEETEEPVVPESEKSADRQIIIKGVRYRSTWKDEQLPNTENKSVEEFDQDRDVRRTFIKRKSPADKIKLPSKGTMKALAFIAGIALIIFLMIQFGPGLWQAIPSLPESESRQDSSSAVQEMEQASDKKDQEEERLIPVPQETEPDMIIEEDRPAERSDARIKVAVIDGSFNASLKLTTLVRELDAVADNDRFSQVKSTIKLPQSKIIWQRTSDPVRSAAIQERVNELKKIIAQQYQMTIPAMPLDFSVVIGADFKLPRLSPAQSSAGQGDEFYIEILNGSNYAGMAKKLNDVLDNRSFEGKVLRVIDYRNADRKNYRVTFLKCEASQNDVAARLVKAIKIPSQIINAPLFDVKLLIGSDITAQ